MAEAKLQQFLLRIYETDTEKVIRRFASNDPTLTEMAYNYDAEDVQDFAAALKSNTSITALGAQGPYGGGSTDSVWSSLPVVGPALLASKCPLKSLYFSDAESAAPKSVPEGWADTCTAVSKSSTLQQFSLFAKISDEQGAQLVIALTSNHGNIQQLSFNAVDKFDRTLVALGGFLKTSPRLTYLKFSSAHSSADSWNTFFKGLQENDRLEMLEIEGGFPDACVPAAAAALANHASLISVDFVSVNKTESKWDYKTMYSAASAKTLLSVLSTNRTLILFYVLTPDAFAPLANDKEKTLDTVLGGNKKVLSIGYTIDGSDNEQHHKHAHLTRNKKLLQELFTAVHKKDKAKAEAVLSQGVSAAAVRSLCGDDCKWPDNTFPEETPLVAAVHLGDLPMVKILAPRTPYMWLNAECKFKTSEAEDAPELTSFEIAARAGQAFAEVIGARLAQLENPSAGKGGEKKDAKEAKAPAKR